MWNFLLVCSIALRIYYFSFIFSYLFQKVWWNKFEMQTNLDLPFARFWSIFKIGQKLDINFPMESMNGCTKEWRIFLITFYKNMTCFNHLEQS